MLHSRCAALAIAVLLAGCGETQKGADGVDQARLESAEDDGANWLTYGRTYSEQRFSPLTKIDTTNVKDLGLAWSFELTTDRGQSATPIVVDGVMYVVSSWSIVHALDAASGKELWRFDPEVPRRFGAKACCDVTSRGVAVWRGKIYLAAFDGRLIALDAKTGNKVWETLTVDQSLPYTITGAPRVARGLVFIGNGGADLGVRGYVGAYDAENGKLAWRFYLVPGDPSKGPDNAASDPQLEMMAKTWTGEWWKIGGGGTAWDTIVYDPAFDQVLVGTGNGSPWNQRFRSPDGGDNLFLCSIVALDAKTGRYRWHYQTTPGETWDYNSTQSIILADLKIGGELRKVAMHAPKNGFFYVIDRANGHLISADPLVPMRAAKDTPAGMPISWATGVDQDPKSPNFGRPIENPEARFADKPVLFSPSPDGARNWHPMAFDPRSGSVFMPVMTNANVFTPAAEFSGRKAFLSVGVTPPSASADPAVLEMARAGLNSALVAWDPISRKPLWRVPHETMWNGGVLATAGNVVFQGRSTGQFVAYDSTTGRELWRSDSKAPVLAGPISYEVNGEQYVAGLSGYGSLYFMILGVVAPEDPKIANGRVLAYKLGGKASLPEVAFEPIEMAAPPAMTVAAVTIERGAKLFGDNWCIACHGVGAVSRSAVPDLRRSPVLQDAKLWKEALMGGRIENGMPSFANHLDDSESEALRAYVVSRAAAAYAEQERTKPVSP